MTNPMITETTEKGFQADKLAFDAYQVLFYDIFGNVFSEDTFKDHLPTPTITDWAYARTVNENLRGTGYTLSDRSVALIAAIHAIPAADVIMNQAKFDPARDIVSFLPDASKYRPMYPDFPTQVIDMPEEQFRADQAMHYLSTYGVEWLFAIGGFDVTVMRGWMPDAPETEKTKTDDKLVSDKVVELICSRDDMVAYIADDVARPKRMSEPAIELLAKLALAASAAGQSITIPPFAFHENMVNFMMLVADSGSSAAIGELCSMLCQHPGDVIKLINATCDKREKNHLTTAQKKGYCRGMESFDAYDIARNIADAAGAGEIAINRLSVARFGGKKLIEGKALVDTGTVKSYNSRVDAAWTLYNGLRDALSGNAANIEGALREAEDDLLATYAERPGMMLRALVRLVENHVDKGKILSTLLSVANSLSLATLVTLASNMSATDIHLERSWHGGVSRETAEEAERRVNKMNAYHEVAVMVAAALAARMQSLDTPFADKKVYLDEGDFSLDGTVILPNAQGGTANAYPPVGTAFKLPEKGVVRFFTFWNDQKTRVDVDTHFKYTDKNGRLGSVGWYSDYNANGMTFSGDITTSDNSAEYLDVDLEKAQAAGIDTIYQQQHIYAPRFDWKDIQECFCGALLVGKTDPDVALYRSDNVIFHDDMNGEGRDMEYATINVPERFIRILRGVKVPFANTAFTARVFTELLMESQNATLVDSIEDADVIASVGRRNRAEGDGEREIVCLIDEKWFVE